MPVSSQENFVPDLSRERATNQEVRNGFGVLAAENVGIILLKIASFALLGRPTSIMNGQPTKEFALPWSPRLP